MKPRNTAVYQWDIESGNEDHCQFLLDEVALINPQLVRATIPVADILEDKSPPSSSFDVKITGQKERLLTFKKICICSFGVLAWHLSGRPIPPLPLLGGSILIVLVIFLNEVRRRYQASKSKNRQDKDFVNDDDDDDDIKDDSTSFFPHGRSVVSGARWRVGDRGEPSQSAHASGASWNQDPEVEVWDDERTEREVLEDGREGEEVDVSDDESEQTSYSYETEEPVDRWETEIEVEDDVPVIESEDDILFVNDRPIIDPYGERGVYTGALSMRTGLPHGRGRLEFVPGGRWYNGDWIHGRWTGYGQISNGDGDFYDGGVKNDHKHGTGIMRFADGRVFRGEYIDGQMFQGQMTYQDESIYTGSWYDGMRHGRGNVYLC